MTMCAELWPMQLVQDLGPTDSYTVKAGKQDVKV